MHSNISIFVPHVGCPHMCAFCNQRTITGTESIPHAADVKRTCSQAMEQIKEPQNTQIAFFGGSFTAVSREYMTELLEAAQEFIGEGKFSGIRISTRPDYIDDEILSLLKKYNVRSIELGAQSMCDEVLQANERGHSTQDVADAARLIKKYGFELGLQMMIGLYKSSEERERESFEKICALRPDTLRIYPVVILEGTALGELYKKGEYKPFSFDTAVKLCGQFLEESQQLGIRVIKLGLHASEFVEDQALGGFYHPAFRELCESEIYFGRIVSAMKESGKTSAVISVPSRNLSKALGQKKSNLKRFENMGLNVKIVADKAQSEDVYLKIIEDKSDIRK